MSDLVILFLTLTSTQSPGPGAELSSAALDSI